MKEIQDLKTYIQAPVTKPPRLLDKEIEKHGKEMASVIPSQGYELCIKSNDMEYAKKILSAIRQNLTEEHQKKIKFYVFPESPDTGNKDWSSAIEINQKLRKPRKKPWRLLESVRHPGKNKLENMMSKIKNGINRDRRKSQEDINYNVVFDLYLISPKVDLILLLGFLILVITLLCFLFKEETPPKGLRTTGATSCSSGCYERSINGTLC